ncbi:hypothetical protein M431DRAFT_505057 [Trichoderma harzianum CBS 226.95]|uniref:Uncharacterized protein n=1 Tax=Trichoderma harzianum CBS 226.95 TaxID=983964 RepID=A0A2T4AK96_TRIHA|nr:hypothetical protein M431DRAFT_505057 [Trichoderma harzianum CBS 226.95]PTB57489.1 hypothetical protein M431DRAFT_505057 [Trichoderma harzianum CBS 226.95]
MPTILSKLSFSSKSLGNGMDGTGDLFLNPSPDGHLDRLHWKARVSLRPLQTWHARTRKISMVCARFCVLSSSENHFATGKNANHQSKGEQVGKKEDRISLELAVSGGKDAEDASLSLIHTCYRPLFASLFFFNLLFFLSLPARHSLPRSLLHNYQNFSTLSPKCCLTRLEERQECQEGETKRHQPATVAHDRMEQGFTKTLEEVPGHKAVEKRIPCSTKSR